MAYLELKKIGYQVHQDKEILDAEYERRFNSFGTITTNLIPNLMKRDEPTSATFPLFIVPLKELAILTEAITDNSKTIENLSDQLPKLAGTQFFYDTLSNEIISTNEIEGVRSTRKEVAKAIEAVENNNFKNIRLASTVKMYMATFEDRNIQIKSPADIRLIYDRLLDNEIANDDLPDGTYFRSSPVKIINSSGLTIHEAPVDEKIINGRMSKWITFINDKNVPFLIKALVGHYFFENTHPFYDGNGRTGRYILSTYLSRKLDKFTGMSLSQIVQAQKSKYYEAFKITGDVDNRSEATFFVLTMMNLIVDSQNTIIETLTKKQSQLAFSENKISEIYANTTPEYFILNLLAQISLFSGDLHQDVKDMDIIVMAKSQNLFNTSVIKRTFVELTKKGYLIQTSPKPLKHYIVEELTLPIA